MVELFDENIKWSEILLSDIIEKGSRLEANTYNTEGRDAYKLVQNGKWPVIKFSTESGFLKQIFYPNRFKRIYVNKANGIEFFMPSQINDLCPKAEKFISLKTECNFEELKLKKNTLLFTRSGTIGNLSIVTKTLENKIFSDDIIRVSLKNEGDLGFVYTFFKSEVGSKILQTNNYGAVITHIEPEHLSNIPIPNPPEKIKKEINDLILKSFAFRDESNELIIKATDLFMKELELPPIEKFEINDFSKEQEVNIFNKKLSCVNNRMDSSYHNPIVDRIIKHMKQYASKLVTLGDKEITQNIILAGIFKRVYVEKDSGIPFLGGKEIIQLVPKVEKYLSKVIHNERYQKELKVRENMILVTDRGTVGVVALVPKHFEDFAVSQNVLKLVPQNDDIAGYIYIYLNSIYGKVLINREIYGSVVDMIDNKSLSKVMIPILKNQKKQKKINEIALMANKQRFEAYLLEKKAIEIMEQEVINI